VDPWKKCEILKMQVFWIRKSLNGYELDRRTLSSEKTGQDKVIMQSFIVNRIFIEESFSRKKKTRNMRYVG
jgi:predicted transcriptional regulator